MKSIYISKVADIDNINNQKIKERALQSPESPVTKHYIAYDGNEEIGFLSLDITENEDYLVLYEIYIEPSLRNKGIGTTLLKLIEHKAKELNYKQIYLRPEPLDKDLSRDQLIDWYVKKGYKHRPDVNEELYKRI